MGPYTIDIETSIVMYMSNKAQYLYCKTYHGNRAYMFFE